MDNPNNLKGEKKDPIVFAVYPFVFLPILLITFFLPILAVRIVEYGIGILFKVNNLFLIFCILAIEYLRNYNYHINLLATKSSIVIVTPFRFWNKIKVIDKLAVDKVEIRKTTMGRFDSKNVLFLTGDTKVEVDLCWLYSDDWDKTVEFLEKNFKPIFERYVNGVKW